MDYVIGEEYTLPSLGKIYNELGLNVPSTVRLRSMTTAEEMKRLNHSDKPYKVLADIIDACLVDKLPISSYDMCYADFEFLLHKLRVVTYGSIYPLRVRCPQCFTEVDEKIDLDSIPVKTYDQEQISKLLEFDLPVTKHHIKIRMQTPRMMDNIKAEVKDFKRRSPSFIGDSAFLFTLKSIIIEIDGQRPDPLNFEDFIINLPMRDSQKINMMSSRLEDSIGLQSQLDITCDVCGLDYKSSFRFTSEFFRPSDIE